MPYDTAEARGQLLDTLTQATNRIGFALASLGEAYELLDEGNADRLEEELFRPVQTAYGRAKRVVTAFAARHGLPHPNFPTASPGGRSKGVRGFLDNALLGVGEADGTLATLQDSGLLVDVGDAELRAGLEEVRRLCGSLRGGTRDFLRTLGR
jgi:hypothetical protein